jgi:hypothetical protein
VESTLKPTIELTKNFKPVCGKLYPFFKVKNEQLDTFINKHVATGHIRPFISPMVSLFFFIKKKDRTLWPVQDYQKLNNMAIKNRYPLCSKSYPLTTFDDKQTQQTQTMIKTQVLSQRTKVDAK